MKATVLWIFIMLAAVLLSGTTGYTQVPGTINYQGRLTGTGGAPLDTTVNMVFTIYTASSGGTALWTETRTGVVVADGLFSVALGSVNPINLSVFGGADRWLGIKVGTDAEMTPRALLSAAPYAQVASWAKTSDTADYAMAGAASGWTDNGANVVLQSSSDNVGIGTNAPQYKLHVAGTILMDNAVDQGVELRFAENGLRKWGIFYAPSDGRDLSIYDDMGNRYLMTFDSGTGFVGIGTRTPTVPLDVAGKIKCSDDLSATERIFIDGVGGDNAEMRLLEDGVGKWGMFFRPSDHRRLSIYDDMANRYVMTFDSGTGFVGIGTGTPVATLDVNGRARVASSLLVGDTMTCDIVKITGGADLAEPFDLHNAETIQPGMLLVIDPANPGKLTVANAPYDHCVAGVVSGAGGIAPGLVMGQAETIASGKYPVAMTGRVYCLADADRAPIRPGDLLTTSAVPGHAMRVTDFDRAQGAVIGKAMTALESGRGLVLVLVSLQ
ncbi:MAG TPA: hypothetical protein PKM94_06265 [candidate division Zixibacteria bacterium]|nr:hypothetical protein [candidate division Zixibacteria bacterium]MDD4918604.1 hypothetical protein [candidate division Zixibacteria bacterium]MDM7974313.1 hypothetical protein [candidate division Zixibacteria bacterium]HOD66283.1 hypothetical protein [candidate division Zixibacteria bacterium]